MNMEIKRAIRNKKGERTQLVPVNIERSKDVLIHLQNCNLRKRQFTATELAEKLSMKRKDVVNSLNTLQKNRCVKRKKLTNCKLKDSRIYSLTKKGKEKTMWKKRKSQTEIKEKIKEIEVEKKIPTGYKDTWRGEV